MIYMDQMCLFPREFLYFYGLILKQLQDSVGTDITSDEFLTCPWHGAFFERKTALLLSYRIVFSVAIVRGCRDSI